ncbi:MAG: hypothetical protein IPK00_14655 [Deltaproteobacteria bacterium]|nr:hypothetical protein [Deltaproteobacteria bacterium]
MDPLLVGGCLARDPAAGPFERLGLEGFEQARLVCACGSDAFRVIGWPRAAVGRGNAFWRTFARVFREARAAMEPPDRGQPPFFLPLFAVCEACGHEAPLFDCDPVPGRLPAEARSLPRESHRCRVCRRSAFALDVAIAAGRDARDGAAALVRAHCRACHRTDRLAWSDTRPSEREQRLDLLYGRR